MCGVIYKITNNLNGKPYIGQTTQPITTRFRQHAKAKTHLDRSICKYGVENFTIEIIEECETLEQLNEREIFWIMRCNCIYRYGYNITQGGAHRHTNENYGSKKNAVREKKFYTRRKWDACPMLEAELQRQGIKCAHSVSRRMKGIYKFTPEQKEAIKKFPRRRNERRGTVSSTARVIRQKEIYSMSFSRRPNFLKLVL